MDQNKKIKKALKSYLSGKKYYNNDKKKSFLYFQQTIKYLNKCKENDTINKKYNDIIDATENECYKYMNSSIESICDREYTNNTVLSSDLHVNKNVFEIINNGNLNEAKKIKFNEINLSQYNETGLTPLHYCIKMGDVTILKILLKLNANIDQINQNGNTLLEYACLERDPNIIYVLIDLGANMKKHLYFRSGDIKYNLNKSDMDLAIILKIIISYQGTTNDLEFVKNYINLDEKIGLDELTVIDLLISLTELLNSLTLVAKNTYIQIIKEEFKDMCYNQSKKRYWFKNNICCPDNKIDLLLIYLVPFINYPFNLSSKFILCSEIKYLMFKILKENNGKINSVFKNKLLKQLWKRYIKTGNITSNYLGNITHLLISKINV